jgi:hypothetical protein
MELAAGFFTSKGMENLWTSGASPVCEHDKYVVTPNSGSHPYEDHATYVMVVQNLNLAKQCELLNIQAQYQKKLLLVASLILTALILIFGALVV